NTGRWAAQDPARDWQGMRRGTCPGYRRHRWSESVSPRRRPLPHLVLPVPRGIRIVARSDSVGVAPASIAPLDADLASAEIPDGLLGRLLGRALGRMDAAGALGAGRFHRPALGMFGHVSVGHICLPVRLTLRLQSV